MSNTSDSPILPVQQETSSTTQKRVARRRLLRGLGSAAAVVGTGGGVWGYSAGYAPFHPVIERIDIPIRGLPPSFDRVRVALLSDLHIQPDFPAQCLNPAVAIVERENPDMIFLLGDYINDQEGDKLRWMTDCINAFHPLKAPLGVFAIFGNHDFPPPPDDPPTDIWTAIGVHTLCNQNTEVKKGKDSIYLCGMRSLLARPVFPVDLLQLTPPDAVRIVLWHEPDRAKECAELGVALQLSGHTHGGQVVVPGVGPPILPVGGKLYPSGLFHVGNMPLYVTRGVGLLPPLVRFNCPPEVTLLTLHSAS